MVLKIGMSCHFARSRQIIGCLSQCLCASVVKTLSDRTADRWRYHPELVHQLGELFRVERLCPIGKSFIRIMMDFHQEYVGASRNRGARHRRNFISQSRTVRWIGCHRQMRKFVNDWDGANIESVPRVSFEGPDTALTKDYVVVSPRHYIFGGEQ